MGGQKLAYSLFVLAVVSRAGLFSFFSAKLGPVGPKPAPDRGWDGSFPHLGWNLATRGLLGATRGLVGFVGRLNVGGFPKCRKERKGRTIPLEGIGQDLRHLMGIFSRVQEGNVQGCTL